MRFGIYVHTHNHLADVSGLAELAVASVEAGWDGFFIWDQLHNEGVPVVDSQIALGAIGLATAGTDLKIGALITPLARRRPWKVAKELATLDSLAPGRVVFGTGLGDETDFSLASSEPQSLRERAAAFEDALAILRELLAGGTAWTKTEDRATPSAGSGTNAPLELRAPSPFLPIPEPPIPVWGSAVILRDPDANQPKRPFRRAASTMDGLFPIVVEDEFDPDQSITPEELRAAAEWAKEGSEGQLKPGFDLVTSGRVHMENSPADPKGLEEAGATWWLETMREEMTLQEVQRIVQKGPPN